MNPRLALSRLMNRQLAPGRLMNPRLALSRLMNRRSSSAGPRQRPVLGGLGMNRTKTGGWRWAG
jgi:hypothetical protein